MSFDCTIPQDVPKTRHTATENTQGCTYTGTGIDANNSEESKKRKKLFCTTRVNSGLFS